MKIAWITDPHLNFVSEKGLSAFIAQQIMGETKDFFGKSFEKPDMILITGDIGESDSVIYYLQEIAKTGIQVVFCLGNHDMYGSSIERVHNKARKADKNTSNLIWIDKKTFIQLTPNVALIGHGSWADCRSGDWDYSNVDLNDYHCISDFMGLGRFGRKQVMQKFANKAAMHVKKSLKLAFDRYDSVYFMTHVPPWREAAVNNGNPSDDDWAPHFVCVAVGDVIEEFMSNNTDKHLIVLCGHSHGDGEYCPLPNIHCITGGAKYCHPKVNMRWEI